MIKGLIEERAGGAHGANELGQKCRHLDSSIHAMRKSCYLIQVQIKVAQNTRGETD